MKFLEIFPESIRKYVPLVGICILLALSFFAVSKGLKAIHDWREDRREQKAQKQIDDQQQKIEQQFQDIAKLTQEAKEWRAKAQVEEQNADTLRDLAAKENPKAAQAADNMQRAGDQYAKDSQFINSGLSDMDVCLRYTCPNRQQLGFPCRPDSAAYCRARYGGSSGATPP